MLILRNADCQASIALLATAFNSLCQRLFAQLSHHWLLIGRIEPKLAIWELGVSHYVAVAQLSKGEQLPNWVRSSSLVPIYHDLIPVLIVLWLPAEVLDNWSICAFISVHVTVFIDRDKIIFRAHMLDLFLLRSTLISTLIELFFNWWSLLECILRIGVLVDELCFYQTWLAVSLWYIKLFLLLYTLLKASEKWARNDNFSVLIAIIWGFMSAWSENQVFNKLRLAGWRLDNVCFDNYRRFLHSCYLMTTFFVKAFWYAVLWPDLPQGLARAFGLARCPWPADYEGFLWLARWSLQTRLLLTFGIGATHDWCDSLRWKSESSIADSNDLISRLLHLGR